MNESQHLADSTQKNPQTVEREIDQTRADMDRTLGALEKKFSPSHLVDQAMDYLSAYGGGVADGFGRFVKDHPVPVTLASLGLAWMFLAPKSTDDFEHDGYGRNNYEDAKEEYAGSRAMNRDAGSMYSDSMIAGAKDRVSSGARHAVQQAQAQTDRLARGLTVIAQEQPLVLAALGIALGAAIGAALPESDPEDRWLGPTRDKAIEKVKEQGEQAYEQVRAAAVRGVEGVKDAVSNVAGVK
jgi:hypothetical protein